MEYFLDNFKVQPLLLDKYLDIGTVGPKGLGVDLHSCIDTYPKAGLQNHATVLDLICKRTLVLFSNVSLVRC